MCLTLRRPLVVNIGGLDGKALRGHVFWFISHPSHIPARICLRGKCCCLLFFLFYRCACVLVSCIIRILSNVMSRNENLCLSKTS